MVLFALNFPCERKPIYVIKKIKNNILFEMSNSIFEADYSDRNDK